MRFGLCAIIVLGIALLVSPVYAYSSLTGPTGTANLPTADIAQSGLKISFSTQSATGVRSGLVDLAVVGAMPFHTEEINAQAWRVAYGLGKKIELSGDYTSSSRTTRGLAVKYLLNGDDKNKNAVGFVYGTTSALSLQLSGYYPPFQVKGESDEPFPPFPGPYPSGYETITNRINTTQVYFAHTATLITEGYKRPAVIGTVGMNYTDMTYRDGVGRAFGSVQFKYMNNIVAMDYQTLNTTIETHAMKSIVLRREFKSGVGVECGWTNSLGMLGDSGDRFFFGTDFMINL